MNDKSDEMVVKERWPDAFEHSSGTIWSHRGWNTNCCLGDSWAAARRYAESIGSKLKVEDGATDEDILHPLTETQTWQAVMLGDEHVEEVAVAPSPTVEAAPDAKKIRKEFEGAITEIGANRTLVAKDDYNKGWNDASDN